MIDAQAARRGAGAVLRAAWRPWHGKLMTFALIVGLWKAWVAVPALVYFGIRGGRVLWRRMLHSVRAKLAAFYLLTALLPLLLLAIILVCVAFVVLGQSAARVVEVRLEKQVEWAQDRQHVTERVYWQARARGAAIPAAAQAALDSAWGDAPAHAVAWAQSGATTLARRGDVRPFDMVVPAWLGDRGFAGIAADSTLQLRTRLHVRDGQTPIEFGGRLVLGSALLNHGLPGGRARLRGGVGDRNRTLVAFETMPDSHLVQSGVVALLDGELPRSRGGPANAAAPLARASLDSTLRGLPGLEHVRLRSRYPLLTWGYVANPVMWGSGRTGGLGPSITIRYTVEGALRTLFATGVGFDHKFVLWLVLTLLTIPLALQIFATWQGLGYARAIARSVHAIERGVRAVRAGDFTHRIAPRERDQLGALGLAVDDMTERMQGLLAERAAHQVVEREIEIARDVQSRLFPVQAPVLPYLEVAGVCVPARVVSGDSYDFVELDSGLDAVISDVSGKGMSAALLMASLHSALRNLYLGVGRGEPPDPGAIVGSLNRHLHQYVQASRFVTFFLARYCGDGQLLYCNAGHNPAALVRNGQVEWLTAGGLMLGPFPDQRYETTRIAVQRGDVVCLYTDGVTEAEAPNGEQFGEERLAAVLRGAAARPARSVLTAVQDAVRAWCGAGEPGDDVTLVVLRITA